MAVTAGSVRAARWSSPVREPDDAVRLVCPACHGEAVLEGGPGAWTHDREQWRPEPCFFTPGCPGTVHPEVLN